MKYIPTQDEITKLVEDGKVHVRINVYSTKKHHGGRAKRGLSTKGNTAAASKLSGAIGGTLLQKIQNLDKTLEEKKVIDLNAQVEKPENKTISGPTYGVGHSVSVETVAFGSVYEEDGKLQYDSAYIIALNVLNAFQNLKVSNGSFVKEEKIAEYDSAKSALIQKYQVNGVIPVENQVKYTREVANLAFVYYEHQAVVTVWSKESIDQSSRFSQEYQCYVTDINSVKFYSQSLLTKEISAWRSSSDKKIKCFTMEFIPLSVIESANGLLRLRRGNRPSGSKTKIYLTQDEYT